MHRRLAPLLVLLLLLGLPYAVAHEHSLPGPPPPPPSTPELVFILNDPSGQGYYVALYRDEPEAPHEGAEYDCAGEEGPSGISESVSWNVEQAIDDGYAWGPPRANPRCAAVAVSLTDFGISTVSVACNVPVQQVCDLVDIRTPRFAAVPIGPDARVSYNFTSGEYSLQLLAPVMYQTQGTSGILMLIDCHHCPPPW